MEHKDNKNRCGFSFIEVMVVVSIIGIMTVAGTVSLNSSKAKSKLEISQRTLTAAIKLVQSYAIQGKAQKISGEQKVPCGYGLVFTSNSEFKIFYNIPTGELTCQDINSGGLGSANNFKYNSNSYSVLIDSFRLESGVILEGFSVTDSIYFSTPQARAYKNSGVSLDTRVYTLKYNSSTKTVSINSQGTITEQ
jgi:prepilin-type N-terminal cleavage/methylation domain-containing protein